MFLKTKETVIVLILLAIMATNIEATLVRYRISGDTLTAENAINEFIRKRNKSNYIIYFDNNTIEGDFNLTGFLIDTINCSIQFNGVTFTGNVNFERILFNEGIFF